MFVPAPRGGLEKRWNVRRTQRFFALGSVVAVAVSIGLAAPAQGLGVGSQNCTFDYSYAGISDSSGAQTWQTKASGCGEVGVRAHYKTYSQSPTYKTSWKYHTRHVVVKPGNIMYGGGHKVTGGGLAWANFREFTT